MKNKLIEHVSGIIFVSIILLGILSVYNASKQNELDHKNSVIKDFLNIPITNINDPFQRSLIKDLMNIYYPDQYEKNNGIVQNLLQTKENELSNKLQYSHLEEHLSINKMTKILAMYIKFIITYSIVMILTWYGVQTLAVWQFVTKKQKAQEALYAQGKKISLKGKSSRLYLSVAKYVIYFILFSPAYVIAYSIKTEFNTDSTFFMILLGVISNGLLITYSNKFYAYLIAESRKGYIDTAMVKNLHSSYMYNRDDGIRLNSIFRFKKVFKGHIFGDIFKNARFQYLPTIKEQASFLITGLIIIEMALNIHGNLNYEMLRQLLYKNYDVVVVIILGIFYTVKITEILTDYLVHRESLKYENK